MTTKTVKEVAVVDGGIEITFEEGGKYVFPKSEAPESLAPGDVFTITKGKPTPVTQNQEQAKPRSTDSSR